MTDRWRDAKRNFIGVARLAMVIARLAGSTARAWRAPAWQLFGVGHDAPETSGIFFINLYDWFDSDGENDVDAIELVEIDTTDTDLTDGTWSFTNLGPLLAGHSYLVQEEGKADWVQTYPNPNQYIIEATSGNDTARDLNFGNFENFDISGYKWNDLDGDGAWDANETGLANWVIYLDGNDAGTAYDVMAITDSTGQYVFSNLGPGTYTVWEQQKSGWTQTYPGGDGKVTVTGASGTDQHGDAKETEALNFGNHSDAPGVRTPGFWQSKFGAQFWDGIVGNEAKAKGADGTAGTADDAAFANGELLPWNDSNGSAAGGLILNPYMIIGGDLKDTNGDGAPETGELKIKLADAQKLINASEKQLADATGDGRWMLARDVVATTLNLIAGNPGGDGLAVNPLDPNDDDPMDLLNEAVGWLKLSDSNLDGCLSLSELGAATKVATSSANWQSPQPGIEHSASLLHTVLNEYNNYGTITLGGITTTWATDADII